MGSGGTTVISDEDEVDAVTTDAVVTAAAPTEAASTTTERRAMLAAAAAGVGLLAAACVPAADPGGASAPIVSPPPTTPPPPTIPPPPVPPTLAQARLLAGRATFGATAAVVNRIISLGTNAWVDEQLDPAGLPDAEGRLGAFTTLRQTNSQNEMIRNTDQNQLFYELDHATLLRGVFSERQLYEVMCDFWSNHFNIWRNSSYLTQLRTVDNEQVIRPFALGKFSDLLMASAKSPAMLVYLNNYESRGDPGRQVNENYGRELLELHTLGIVNGAQVYSEVDILGAAKVLSGWSINWTNGATKYDYVFNASYHSREAVSILGGAWTCPARPTSADYRANGMADGESLIRFLAHHSATARYICFKLARRFVGDDPPMGLVDRLAQVYTANDTAIAPVLRELFRSAEFAASGNSKVKRPIDWLYSALRATGASVVDAPRGQASSRLRSAADALGQPLNERVTPDGYSEKAADWIAADGLLKRWEYGAKISRNQITDSNSTEKVAINVLGLVPAPLPPTNRALVAAIANNNFQVTISSSDETAICTALSINPDAAVTTLATDATKLQTTVGLLLGHPQFHRR